MIVFNDKIREETDRVLREHGKGTKRMSGHDAQKVTGISYGTIYKMLKDGYAPEIKQVLNWASGMGESVSYWLRLCGYEEEADTFEAEARRLSNAKSVDPWINKMITLVSQIPNDRRDMAAGILESMSK